MGPQGGIPKNEEDQVKRKLLAPLPYMGPMLLVLPLTSLSDGDKDDSNKGLSVFWRKAELSAAVMTRSL